MFKRYFIGAMILGLNLPIQLYASATPDTFIRTVNLETSVFETDKARHGAQSFRIRTRYLDPDVNAFVGLGIYGHHFNEGLPLFDPVNPEVSPTLLNWGGVLGLVRGRSLWEFDIMGGNFREHLGFTPGVLGEHHMTRHWLFYHATTINIFAGATLLDADQGFLWQWKSISLSAGYRVLAAKHFMTLSGPSVGIRWTFESPKIPFLFPSLG